MFHRPARSKGTSRQTGGALAIAVFVILVMSLLTIAISKNISASSDQTVQEILGARALMAAESANELGLSQLFPIANGSPATTGSCSDVTTSLRYFNNVPGLRNCVVITNCTSTSAGGEQYFLLNSRGVCKNGLSNTPSDQSCQLTDQVCASRELEVEAKAL